MGLRRIVALTKSPCFLILVGYDLLLKKTFRNKKTFYLSGVRRQLLPRLIKGEAWENRTIMIKSVL